MGCINSHENFLENSVQNNKKILNELTFETCHKFAITGVHFAKVLKIYDGDTIHIGVKYKDMEYQNWSIRLYGIDCPEMRPIHKNRTPQSLAREKAAAQLAKSFVEEIFTKSKFCVVEFICPDKYSGRQVAKIFPITKKQFFSNTNENEYVNNVSLSQMLLNEKHAIEYNGKKKMAFDATLQQINLL
jgi:endonuclease YncB( thermonuclease family)